MGRGCNYVGVDTAEPAAIPPVQRTPCGNDQRWPLGIRDGFNLSTEFKSPPHDVGGLFTNAVFVTLFSNLLFGI